MVNLWGPSAVWRGLGRGASRAAHNILCTAWGGNLFWRFCILFSERSPCLLGQHGSCSTAQRPGELSENILQNLFHKLPPQTVHLFKVTVFKLQSTLMAWGQMFILLCVHFSFALVSAGQKVAHVCGFRTKCGVHRDGPCSLYSLYKHVNYICQFFHISSRLHLELFHCHLRAMQSWWCIWWIYPVSYHKSGTTGPCINAQNSNLRTPPFLESGAAGCKRGFVTFLLKVPLPCLSCMAVAIQPNCLWNSQKTFYKAFYSTCCSRLYTDR